MQNAGVAELAVTEVFEGEWEVPQRINDRFREILRQTFPYLNEFEAFLQSVNESREDALLQLIECDNNVIEAILAESNEDVTRAFEC